MRAGMDLVDIRERGYRERAMTVTLSALPRILGSMMKTEFPRSRKVRVYRLACAGEADREMKKL